MGEKMGGKMGEERCEGDRETAQVSSCCVEACPLDCYLMDSGLYVHESCCQGNERHPLTHVGCRRFWYSPLIRYGS